MQHLFTVNSLAVYILCALAGFSDGVNDCIVALRFYSSPFWGKNCFTNKNKYGWLRREVLTFTCDGWHLTKFITPIFFSIAFALNNQAIGFVYMIACFLSVRLGRSVAYDIVFKKK